MNRFLPLVALAACGGPLEAERRSVDAEAVAHVETRSPLSATLRLETRDGDSRLGYSFATHGLVERESADVWLTAWDCGARGRWVDLVMRDGSRVSAGGTGEAFEGEVEVRNGDTVLGKLSITKHSPTPTDWYEAQPIPPYEVTIAAD
jgi:hypothetical protein